MAQATLSIDLGAICSNWQALGDLSRATCGAVVKADGYGLGAAQVSRALANAGAREFFVAQAQEGAVVREALGSGPVIYIFGGHMAGDKDIIRDYALTPLLNSIDQMLRHVEALPGAPFGIQLDSGMNRLGMEPGEWFALRDLALASKPKLIVSHLACADEPGHAMNAQQLGAFRAMTDGVDVPRSLAATGGCLLGAPYHFEVTRPGVGLYGGLPFEAAKPVVTLDIPVIQVRELEAGETVGYGNTYIAEQPCKIATVSAGYADGLLRAMGPQAALWAGDTRCPVAGRVSMDLITVDVTALGDVPETLQMLGAHQGVDQLADWAGTIGYEILTSLGGRYDRIYEGA